MSRKYVQGKFQIKNPTKYIGKGTPTYRSGWEFAFMQFCDNNPSILNWASESINIPYRNPFTNKQTIYVPDFFIVYVDKDGSKHAELIEVKPMNQTTMERAGKSSGRQKQVIINTAKWEAATAYARQNRITFRVLSEEQLFHQGKRK